VTDAAGCGFTNRVSTAGGGGAGTGTACQITMLAPNMALDVRTASAMMAVILIGRDRARARGSYRRRQSLAAGPWVGATGFWSSAGSYAKTDFGRFGWAETPAAGSSGRNSDSQSLFVDTSTMVKLLRVSDGDTSASDKKASSLRKCGSG
jgi:hypothetical protein